MLLQPLPAMASHHPSLLLPILLGLFVSSGCERGGETPSSGGGQARELHPFAKLPPLSDVELSPRAGAAGGTLFEKLDPAAAGLDFVHRWEPRGPREEMLQKTGFTGGGVAAGDYDGDGLTDLYLTRPHGGGRLYRNLGGFRFEDATAAAGVDTGPAWTTGACFNDVDGDGLLDLFVCAHDSDNHLFLNRGGGRFEDAASASGLNSIGANVKMAFADYDLDGDLDAYLVTNRLEPVSMPPDREVYEGSPGEFRVREAHRELVTIINLPDGTQKFTKAGQFDRLFRSRLADTGELRFEEVAAESGIDGADHGLDATWWDYDADGDPDLYVSNDFTDPDKFYRNRGDGTFEEIALRTLPHTPWFTMGSAAGDLDGDGLLDLVAADMSATTHFREKVSMGSMDAVAWFLDTAEPRQFMRNAVYLNTGTDRFMEVAHMAGLASSNWTWSIKVADLDGDGREDVFATNGFPFDYLDSDFAAELARSGRATDPAAWRQAPRLPEADLAFQNLGDLRFEPPADGWGLGGPSISFGAACADLDGDGDPDLVVNRFGEAPGLFRNRSEADWIALELRSARGRNTHALGATVSATTADGGRQLRYLNGGGGYLSADAPGEWLIGLGGGGGAAELEVRWPGGAVQTLAGLRAGRRYTVVEPEPAGDPPGEAPPSGKAMFVSSDLLAGAVHRERPYDDFAREPLLPNRLSQSGPPMAFGDLDGDGDEDYFLGGAAGQAGQVFLRAADGRVVAAPGGDALAADAESEDTACALFDADADGDLDLYVGSGSNEWPAGSERYADRLYLNDGAGSFAKAEAALPDTRDSTGGVAAADYDLDGDIDLFVGARAVPGAYPTAPPSRVLRNEGGRFVEAHALEAGMVTAAQWADFDGNGYPNLLVATEYGPVRIWGNDEGELSDGTSDAGIEAITGWWNGLAVADVDGDGDLDFAATNFGLNTKYHPSEKKPQLLYYADFAGDGHPQIVEAKLRAEGLLPVRGKSCSTAAMPHLGEKFATFREFAGATLGEIYTEECLEEGLRLEANTLEAGVFLNEGSGRFRFAPLPRIAQASPSFGAVFFDADGDPHPDLFLAQNFFGPQRETGRMAGGLGQLLLGNGDGSFRAVPPRESGIVIPEDAVAVAAVDLNDDGQTDLAVSTNNGAVRAFVRSER